MSLGWILLIVQIALQIGILILQEWLHRRVKADYEGLDSWGIHKEGARVQNEISRIGDWCFGAQIVLGILFFVAINAAK